MEVRCPYCNKLFRVSDDKIQGSGIKFGCTRCSKSVKITRDDFEKYLSSGKAEAAQVESKFAPVLVSPVHQNQTPTMPLSKSPEIDLFDLSPPSEVGMPVPAQSVPAEPAVQTPKREIKSEIKPEKKSEVKSEHRSPDILSRPASNPKPEAAAAGKPEHEIAPAAAPEASSAPAPEVRPAAYVFDAGTPQSTVSSGIGRKMAIILVAAIIVVGSAAAMKYYQARSSRPVQDAVQRLISPEGLRIRNASGTMDPVKQDLVISGIVENMTDKPKMGWYVLAEVYDAQGAVLIRSKLVNGKQLYTTRDYDIMAGRGENIQDIKIRQLQEPGMSIPAMASVNFEIRVMAPPDGIASFNATLQPFDPVQLFKEMAGERK